MNRTLPLKILLSLTLAFATISVNAVLASVIIPPQDFSDVGTMHPNYPAIHYLKEHNIINGYPDGTFKPNQVVTRVEALKFILLGAGIPTDQSKKIANFPDIQQGQWYSVYINTAAELGIIQGYPDGTFKPTKTVNVVENLKMLILAKKIDTSKAVSQADITKAPYADAFANQWYTAYLIYAKNNNLIDADAENKIYPSMGMTRAKLAEMMFRFMTLPASSTPTQNPPLILTPTPGPSLYDLTGLVLTLNIQNSAFSKNSMTVGTGTTIQWTNMDNFPHTITSDDGIFESGSIAPGKSFSYTFKTVSTYAYHCALHPAMKGTIIVKPAIQVPSI